MACFFPLDNQPFLRGQSRPRPEPTTGRQTCSPYNLLVNVGSPGKPGQRPSILDRSFNDYSEGVDAPEAGGWKGN